MTSIRAFPRLHLGLACLSEKSHRRYGGAGFVIDWSPIELSARLSQRSTSDFTLLDRRGRHNLRRAIARLQSTYKPRSVCLSLRSIPPQHIGLGTKTATVLGALRLYCRMSGLTVENKQLQQLSGRGGASGVGIHGFFTGGFVVDGGRRVDATQPFAPSGRQRPAEVPFLLSQLSIPSTWRFVLLLPEGRRYSGRAEAGFFDKNAPIPLAESQRTLELLHHVAVPAVQCGSIADLKDALYGIRRVGFKKREVRGQPHNVSRLLSALEAVGRCAVGMSSMGPLVYVIVDEHDQDTSNGVRETAMRHGAEILGVCAGRNAGYEVLQ